MDLIIAHPFLRYMGGAERTILEIAKEFDPIIYASIYQPENTFEEFKEFDIRTFNQTKLPLLTERHSTAINAGYHFLKTKIRDYDILNCHGCPSEFLAKNNDNICWFVHSPNREAYDLREWRLKHMGLKNKIASIILSEAYKKIEEDNIPKIPHLLTNSENTNRRIQKYFKRNDARIINPGVNPREFYCEEYQNYFFAPSRIVPEKQFKFIIEAFKMFCTKSKDYRLIIAGFCPDKNHLEKLKALSKGYNIRFIVNPSENRMKDLYANCYAVLFAGKDEDWGIVPLEAMASEKPIISVNEGGMRESIVPHETGYLVDNEPEMAFAMIYLHNRIDEVYRLGKTGRNRVLKNYTWKHFITQIKEQFKVIS